MSNGMIFKAFFSYAHHDARADPKLVDAITKTLPSYVISQFVNDTFELWRDTEDLRTGERWDARIEEALRASHVLIVLLTPRWIGSDYCRREYRTFEDVEPGLGAGEYVAPLLARPIDPHELTDDQRDIWARLQARQNKAVSATNFLKLSDDQRRILVEELAKEIAAMLRKRRRRADSSAGTAPSPASGELAKIQRELSQANQEAERRHQQ